MKEGIHPEYKEVTIRCACGETVVTRSTKSDANGEIRVEICSIKLFRIRAYLLSGFSVLR